ncbi:MAG: hypothetical protein JOZ14_13295 [Acidobacteria bacterium]|nr:hypothetical protein [Acidobacteriota bacterium]
MCACLENTGLFVFHRILVNGNAADTLRGGREEIPPFFRLYEGKKKILLFHLKLHLATSSTPGSFETRINARPKAQKIGGC